MGKNKKGKGRGQKKRRRVGHRPHYRGLPLTQLLANLPNRGVGRLITRGSFKQNEEEPSYMRILEVDFAAKRKHKTKGKTKLPVKVERIWRGVLFPRPVSITSTSYLPDFNLVPKEKEELLLKNTKTPREKGYVYWNAEQKKNIRALVAQGLSIAEAKQKEKERIFREEAEAAARDGTAPPQEPSEFDSTAIVCDNFDENDDDGDEDEHDSDESFDPDWTPNGIKIKNHFVNMGKNKKGKGRGLSIAEAKQKEKERIFREEAEAAARDGTAPPQEPSEFDSTAIVCDNFDENDDDGDEDEHDSDEYFDPDWTPNGMNTQFENKKSTPAEIKRCDKTNNRSHINIVTSQRSEYVEAKPDDISFDHFTAEQKQRVENMTSRGVQLETAQQLEWERQIAFERAAADESNNMV